MHSINALELPEVARIIAGYLNYLKPCLAVCKSWRSLYLPYYWREVVTGFQMGGKEFIPFFDPLRQGHYRKFIKVLTVHSYLGAINLSLDCPNLRMLRLYNRGEEVQSRFYDEENPVVKDFVNRHPLLECLKLDNIPPFIMDSTWTALVDHPRLDKLVVRRITSVPDDFWRVCARLRTLDFRCLPPQCYIPKNLVLLSVRRLTLIRTIDQNAMDELDIIVACPLLEELFWIGRGANEDPMWARLSQLAIQGTWPRLHRLSMLSRAKDADLSQVIASMHRATKVEIFAEFFGPLSFAALRRHAGTLRHLSIPRGMTSSMIRDVLCTFPRLDHLLASRIDARDIAEGSLWACTSLRKMAVEISFSSEEDHLQPVVFERMSRLVHLEEFDNGICHVLESRPRHGLIFRLQSGMGALAGLSRLRSIGMSSDIQAMDLDDARWIIDHWKRLETIRGLLSQDKSIREQLQVLFSTNEIKLQADW